MKTMKTGKLEDYGTLLFKIYSGSTSYGTSIDETYAKKLSELYGEPIDSFISDVDFRGVFVPYPEFSYGLKEIEDFIDPNEEDSVYFSLKKFTQLIVNGTPNTIEFLFVDPKHIVFQHELFQPFLDNRNLFLTKKCFNTFGSYAKAQLKKMVVKDSDFKRNKKRMALIGMTSEQETPYDCKNAMHLIRLLQMAIEIFTTNHLSTFRPNRDELLEIRHGKFSLEEIIALSNTLFDELERVHTLSSLPNVPNTYLVNNLVVDTTLKANNINSMYTASRLFPNAETKILPIQFEMVPHCCQYLSIDPLGIEHDSSHSFGFFVPPHDWFIGLYRQDEFSFDNTTIDSFYKFCYNVISCNPKHLFAIFSPDNFVLRKTDFSTEIIRFLKQNISQKSINSSLKGFVTGNLNKMKKWEELKEENFLLIEKRKEAQKKDRSYFDELLSEAKRNPLQDEKEQIKRLKKISFDFNEWKDLLDRKQAPSYYPPVPKSTNNRSASMMGKFGYDTYTAAIIYLQLAVFDNFLNNKETSDFESDIHLATSILNGKFGSFEEFYSFVSPLITEVSSASKTNLPLEVDHTEFYKELRSFIFNEFLS